MDFPESVLKLDKKGPTLSQKRLTLSVGNFGLLAPKLMRYLSKDRNLKDHSFNCIIFHEQIFCAHKTRLKHFTIAYNDLYAIVFCRSIFDFNSVLVTFSPSLPNQFPHRLATP